MWINGIDDRPTATVYVDLPADGLETPPIAIAVIDGVLQALESQWDPEGGRVSVRIPSSARGLGFVQAALSTPGGEVDFLPSPSPAPGTTPDQRALRRSGKRTLAEP